VLLSLPAAATEAEGELQFLRQFISGHYRIVGQEPEGGASYRGTLRIPPGGAELRRTIEGKGATASIRLERSSTEGVALLRLHYREGESGMEGSCLIGSDLDNYARITCLTYKGDGTTTSPGLEAWFIAPPEVQ
jgi:hypothetical protein